MFKGLRTKLETEQKIQGGQNSSQLPKVNDEIHKQDPFDDNRHREPKTDRDWHVKSEALITESNITSGLANSNALPTLDDLITSPLTRGYDPKAQRSGDGPEVSLQDEISRLSDQLKAVTKEKEDSNDQNAQLYQLIEKLRRNLESEKETNANLRSKVNELETKLLEDNHKQSDSKGNMMTNISLKPINHFKDLPRGNSPIGDSNDIDTLRHEVIELQAQLAKKNRLLKIKQQNLNDLKKTLQKEMFHHGKAQDELAKVQKQLKELESQNKTRAANEYNPTSRNDFNSHSNIVADIQSDITRDHNQDLNGNRIQQLDSVAQSSVNMRSSPFTSGAGGEDTLSLSNFGAGTQSDRISYMSRSSASVVDEFESNDLHKSNHDKVVNHEYLKNVLYRYMTSSDNETAQHLVKALTVLMDFSPDQSAAIKRAQHHRNSWLRLK